MPETLINDEFGMLAQKTLNGEHHESICQVASVKPHVEHRCVLVL